MAQRLILNKPPFKVEMIIDDDELAFYEFQEFWEKVKRETNVSIDTYSGEVVNLKKNRKLALLITSQLFRIEEEFPEVKQSRYDKKKQITKSVVIRFFQNFLELLNKSNNQKIGIRIDGE